MKQRFWANWLTVVRMRAGWVCRDKVDRTTRSGVGMSRISADGIRGMG